MNIVRIQYYDSPCGKMILGSFGECLCLCDWCVEGRREGIDRKIRKYLDADYKEEESPVLKLAVKQLDEYFSNERTIFDIPLLFTGTDFQRLVLEELLKIPYGTTVSYSELAERVGRPSAVRAVANANRRNPLSLFVPCHRVIGGDGSLTGYAGGLNAKKILLDLESKR